MRPQTDRQSYSSQYFREVNATKSTLRFQTKRQTFRKYRYKTGVCVCVCVCVTAVCGYSEVTCCWRWTTRASSAWLTTKPSSVSSHRPLNHVASYTSFKSDSPARPPPASTSDRCGLTGSHCRRAYHRRRIVTSPYSAGCRDGVWGGRL